MTREPITIVEIDVDFCTRSFGLGACTATLALAGAKCFNTTATCAARSALNLGKLTLRFIEPRANLPKGATYFPALISADSRSSTVNLAGADDRLSALGKRAEVSVELQDFTYHDRLTDKYAAERGYDPASRGTFFSKLKARWPYYGGRALRIINAYIDGGVISGLKARHYIITDMLGPNDGRVTIEAKDVLALADDDRKQAPKPSPGTLAADIATDATTLTLSPAGIGNSSYPASGRAVIGSEMVDFTRVNNTITLTRRGVRGTQVASHSAGDTFQETFSVYRQRIDTVLRGLLVDMAGINPAFIPTAKWKAEIDRWASARRLTTDIPKSTGVAKLVGEIAILGVSIWWDEVAQEIGLKINRPIREAPKAMNGAANLASLEIEDRDEDRLTQVAFYTVMEDPTKSATDSGNYARQRLIIDTNALDPDAYGDTRVKEIHCRWLDHGDDAGVRILGRRFLQRFNRAPVRYVMEVDARDDMALTEVMELRTDALTRPDGAPVARLAQVICRSDVEPGHRVQLTAQGFQFDGRYGYITPSDWPNYDAATPAQKEAGFFIAPSSGFFADGAKAYEVI